MLLVATLAGHQARSQTLDASSNEVSTVAGAWQVAQAGSNRACTIRLNAQASDGGLLAGVPATCRRALPILLKVAAWSLNGDTAIALLTAEGENVLTFRSRADGGFEGRAASGQVFELRPDPGGYQADAKGQAVAGVALARINPAVPPALAGRYALLRDGDATTGCTLTLETRIGPRIGSGRAVLAPGCADQGLLTFDPAGWKLEGKDRLFLIARKGQQIGFSREKPRDPSPWFKDPANGAPLRLMRQP